MAAARGLSNPRMLQDLQQQQQRLNLKLVPGRWKVGPLGDEKWNARSTTGWHVTPTNRSRSSKSSFSVCLSSSSASFWKCALGPATTTSSSAAAAGAAGAGGRAFASLAPVAQPSDVKEEEEEVEDQEEDKPKPVTFNYGFQADFLREGPSVPHNVFRLAIENFGREYLGLRRNLLFEEPAQIPDAAPPKRKAAAYLGRAVLTILRGIDRLLTTYDALPKIKPADPLATEGEEVRKKLQQLKLSNEGVAERENRRPPVPAPGWIMGPYFVLCAMLDVIFNERPIQRFWFLETVARMPYFSYISMLHLYETLGWWRAGAEVRKVHFAEEWNEMNHLRIMESLGGDKLWVDRFFAQHAAFFYYWILNFMFLVSPKVAYNFSELIEAHAVDTYAEFVDENEALLKTLPPSPAAVAYYLNDDLYMFDEFQTSRMPESRRPEIESLYDVFCAIRDDEGEHVKTMWACQQLDYTLVSPHRMKFQEKRPPQPLTPPHQKGWLDEWLGK